MAETPTQIPVELLAPALSAARRALRGLDADHVPARLRDISARSGRLPGPLAGRLIDELEQSEWLRAETLDVWPEASLDSEDGVERASALFLRRPDGWEAELEALIRQRQERSGDTALMRVTLDLGRATKRIDGLEAKLAAAESEAVLEVRKVEQKSHETLTRARRGATEAKSVAAKLRSEVEDLTEELRRGVEKQAGLEAMLAELRSRAPDRKQPVKVTASRRAWPPRTPLELARLLDDTMAAAAIPTAGEPSVKATPMEPVRLPSSMRPDDAGAIRWLLSIDQAVTVLVDGWNVAYLLAGGQPVGKDRDTVLVAARRLRKQARGRLIPMVVFDSRLGADTSSAPDLIFAPSADQHLVELSKGGSGNLVVISSDREVREQIEANGAIGLWSEALVDWFRRR